MSGLFNDPTQIVSDAPSDEQGVVVADESGFGALSGGGQGIVTGNPTDSGVIVADTGSGVFSDPINVSDPGLVEAGVTVGSGDGTFGVFEGGGTSVIATGNTATTVSSNELQYDNTTHDLTSIVNGVRSNTVTILVDEPESLNDLTDVTTRNVSNDQFLRYDAATRQWMNESVDLADIDDVLDAVQPNTILVRNSANTTWVPIAAVLSSLSDVDTSGATTGQVLQFDGSTWTPRTINIPSQVITSVSTAQNNHIQLQLSQSGELSVTSNIERYVESASVSGDTLTLTNDDGTTVTFTPSGGPSGSGTAVEVNGNAVANVADFRDGLDITWTTNTTPGETGIVATASAAIARIAQVASWAQTGNTDLIPDSKLSTAIARVVQIATWAQTGDTSTIPDAKLSANIARTNQLAEAFDGTRDVGIIQRVTRVDADTLRVTGANGTFDFAAGGADELVEWSMGTNYEVGQVVYIIGAGLYVRRNAAGASDPRTDSDDWSQIEENAIHSINRLTGGADGNITIAGGDNITIANANNTVTISAPDPGSVLELDDGTTERAVDHRLSVTIDGQEYFIMAQAVGSSTSRYGLGISNIASYSVFTPGQLNVTVALTGGRINTSNPNTAIDRVELDGTQLPGPFTPSTQFSFDRPYGTQLVNNHTLTARGSGLDVRTNPDGSTTDIGSGLRSATPRTWNSFVPDYWATGTTAPTSRTGQEVGSQAGATVTGTSGRNIYLITAAGLGMITDQNGNRYTPQMMGTFTNRDEGGTDREYTVYFVAIVPPSGTVTFRR